MTRVLSFIGGESFRHHLWLAVAAAFVFFSNLGGPRLWDDDEPRNSQCAREMLARGDWVVPTFNDKLRTDKPVLLYWLMMGAYRLWGVSEFSARVWSALLGTGTVLLTYRIGRRLFAPQVGLWAAFMLATNLMFAVSSRAATPDATLIFFTTLAMYAWVSRSPGRWGHLPTYAAIGLAVLAKGPVGMVLPLGVLGCHALCVLRPAASNGARTARVGWRETAFRAARALLAWLAPARVWRAALAMRPVTGLALVAALALPWYALVGIATDGEWLLGFLGRHNFGRFSQAMEGHGGPFFYYVPAVLVGFFPWSIFLGLAIWLTIRKLAERGVDTPERAADLPAWQFVACWAGVYVGFFSLSSTKLPSYVLPAYPAIALITAAFVRHWRENPASVKPALAVVALGSFALVGIGVAAGLPIAAHFVFPGEAWLGVLGAPLAVGGAIAIFRFRRGQLDAMLRALAVASVVFAAGLFAVGASAVSEHTNAVSLTDKIRDASPNPAISSRTIGAYRYSAPGLVFYANQPIQYFEDARRAANLFVPGADAFLIVPHDRLEELLPLLPPDVIELSRERRFLRRKDLVLLGRRPAVARAPQHLERR